MSSTQKKTTRTTPSTKTPSTKAGGGKAPGGKPSGTAKAGTGGRSVKNKRDKGPVYLPNDVSRGVGAAVCLFFAVMLLLGMCGVKDAVVVDFLCHGVQGLVGYGFWSVAPVLVLSAVFLLAKREAPVRLRLWCLGFLPLLLGSLFHLLLSPYSYEMGFSALSSLWRDGVNGFSGGTLGGALALSFSAWFSSVGAGLLFVLVTLALVAGIFQLTPTKFLIWLRKRRERLAWEEEYEFDEDEEYARYESDQRRRKTSGPQEEYLDDAYDLPPVYSPAPLPSMREPASSRWPSFLPKRNKKIPDIPLDKHSDQPETTPESAPVHPPEEKRPTAPTVQAEPDWEDVRDQAPEPVNIDDAIVFEDDLPLPPDIPWQPDPAQPDAAAATRTTGRAAVSPMNETAAPAEKSPTKAQRRQDIQQQAQELGQEIEQNLQTAEEEPRTYLYPSVELLTPPSGQAQQAAHEELEDTLNRLAGVLTSFGIDGHVQGAVQGPSVTRYEISLEQGVRLNKLTNLADDVALALGVSNVRIAPVPGKISVVGIEVPNKVVTPVPIREVLESENFRRHKSSAAFSVGKDIGGNCIVGDCAKLPHMLIAGTTGSGKSVCINSLLISMLYKSTPEELRLIMVDPKMVELGGYNGIPHLLIPVVTDPKKAAGALQWAVTEMMKRYRLFAEAGVRELSSYNQWAKTQEKPPMAKVVIVIDELADLMLVAAKEVEESICRVAQMGRASGMHLVIATQRPSADVITGLMKANIPSRVAFAVASSLESRIILDTTGAEKLVGKGDMLWFPLGSAKPLRVQGCFISDEEVAAVVDSVKQNSTADYDNEVMAQIEQHVTESEKKGSKSGGSSAGVFPAGEESGGEQDELFPAAVDVILELGQASVSMLQRRLKLGYARAARLVDQMEEQGIVGPFEGSKPRQLLITKEQWQQMQGTAPTDDPPFPEADPPVEEEILTFEAVPQRFEGED